jgi:very-short-patch-repair endonuclease
LHWLFGKRVSSAALGPAARQKVNMTHASEDAPNTGAAASRGEVLVAIMNNLLDFAIAQEQQWYRIPVRSASNMLRERWPPQWLAFYQTKVFGAERWAINYYAPVLRIRTVARRDLLPEDPGHPRADELYHKLELGPLQRLPQPMLSRRWRRIVFIPTTWEKFISAVEINDLYDESPLEDRLWAEFKRHDIDAERQYFVQPRDRLYALDFAIFCDQGNLDVETDGDTYREGRDRRSLDYRRDADLARTGWKVIRFRGQEIREEAAEYCIPAVMQTMNSLGGLSTEGLIPRKFDPDHPDAPRQLTLFETRAQYDVDSW